MKTTIERFSEASPVKTVLKRRTAKKSKAATGKQMPHQLPYKGRKFYTVEETAQRNCPFPDESEWVDELERIHAMKSN